LRVYSVGGMQVRSSHCSLVSDLSNTRSNLKLQDSKERHLSAPIDLCL